MKPTLSKQKKLLPLAALSLILLVCLSLWIGLSAERYQIVYSSGGAWDLRDFDFVDNNARLQGHVEFIPGDFLTPEEFYARADEIIIGYAHEAADYSTSRVRLLLPDDSFHTVSRISTDFADRIFVNGIWLHDVGLPADNMADVVPFTARVTFTARADNADGYYVIEIIQQTSNLGMRGRGVLPQDWRVGEYAFYNTILRADYSVNIVLGAYIALFLSFMLLFVLMQGYRPNLYFALFCLMWFLRTGVTSSARVFAVLLPWLPGIPSMRIEYIAMPVTAILLLTLIRELFPGLLHKIFYRWVTVVSAVFAAAFLFGNAILMGYAILLCQIFYSLCIIYVAVRFAVKLRDTDAAQRIFVAGALFFMYSAVRDFTYYSFPQFSLPPFAGTNLTQIAMLAFAFCQATTVFIASMREVEEAKANRQKAAAERAALETMNRMKNEFMANMSHELITPLAVIDGYADLARWEVDASTASADTQEKLLTISMESRRLSRLVKQLLSETEGKRSAGSILSVAVHELSERAAVVCEPVLAKNNNRLDIQIEADCPSVKANPDMIFPVLVNLVNNANRHVSGGVIIITARRTGGGVLFSVEDEGEGIPPDMLASIFERGYSGDGGTGLGLAICKEAVEVHGGTIAIESEPGKGTRVTFSLPMSDENKGGSI